MRLTWATSAFALSTLVACESSHFAPDHGVIAQPVAGDVDSEERYPGVLGMAIRKGQSVARCTGVLIGPNLLLSARHCVSPTVTGLVECGQSPLGPPYPGSDVRATTKVVETDDPLDYVSGRDVRVVPGGNDECGFDLAAVLLEEPGIQTAVAASFVPRVDLAVQPDELFTAVGYGSDGSGALGTRRVRDGLRVVCVGGNCPLAVVQPTEWMGEDGGVCRGDSGAPAFDSKGQLIGIVSRGANECDYPIHSGLFSRKNWLIEIAQEAAALGGYPPPEWAGGPSTPEPGPGSEPNEPRPAPDPAGSNEGDGCSLVTPSPSSATAAGWLTLVLALSVGSLRACKR